MLRLVVECGKLILFEFSMKICKKKQPPSAGLENLLKTESKRVSVEIYFGKVCARFELLLSEKPIKCGGEIMKFQRVR